MHCGYANQTRRPPRRSNEAFLGAAPAGRRWRCRGPGPEAGGGGRSPQALPLARRRTEDPGAGRGSPRARGALLGSEARTRSQGRRLARPQEPGSPRSVSRQPGWARPGARRLLRLCCRVAAGARGLAELQPPETREQLPPAPPACALRLPGRAGEGPRGLPGSGAEAAPALLQGRGPGARAGRGGRSGRLRLLVGGETREAASLVPRQKRVRDTSCSRRSGIPGTGPAPALGQAGHGSAAEAGGSSVGPASSEPGWLQHETRPPGERAPQRPRPGPGGPSARAPDTHA
ncbi:uncharacterized protein LOC144269611 [Eretmochelys imbricata]